VITLAALTAARLGKLQQAQILSKQLNDQFPAGTYVQKYWLPLIRAEDGFEKGTRFPGCGRFEPAEFPLELAGPTLLPVATLYPAYVRGEAYLAADDGPRAAIEFQKLRDHRTLLANYPMESMALSGLARADTRAGENQKARQNYREFFDLWKDADPAYP
jgi:hypothetical protein